MYARRVRPAGVVPAGLSRRSSLALAHVDGRTRALGEVGDADEVIPVPVRDEDRRARRTEPREQEPELGRVAARIDDDGLG